MLQALFELGDLIVDNPAYLASMGILHFDRMRMDSVAKRSLVGSLSGYNISSSASAHLQLVWRPPPWSSSSAETPSHWLPLRLTGDSQHFKWGGGVLYPTGLWQDTDHMRKQLT